MYQWKKFEFFEEKSGRCSIPSDVEGNLQCCSSGRGRIALGCDDGMVHLLDRGFKPAFSFRAHAANVLFIQHLKVFIPAILFFVNSLLILFDPMSSTDDPTLVGSVLSVS